MIWEGSRRREQEKEGTSALQRTHRARSPSKAFGEKIRRGYLEGKVVEEKQSKNSQKKLLSKASLRRPFPSSSSLPLLLFCPLSLQTSSLRLPRSSRRTNLLSTPSQTFETLLAPSLSVCLSLPSLVPPSLSFQVPFHVPFLSDLESPKRTCETAKQSTAAYHLEWSRFWRT